MVTIRDIAQRLGIAVSTVSKGLNGAPDVSAETRQLVLDTAVEMGYAAKRARRQAQPKVCVLVENMEYANIGQFGYEIVAGFRLAAAARGWAVDVLPTTPEAQARTKYGSLLLEGGYGGAFILGLTPQDAYMRALAGTGTPTVLLDNCVPNASVGYVGTGARFHASAARSSAALDTALYSSRGVAWAMVFRQSAASTCPVSI